MKEIKLKVDDYKNIDIRGLQPNQYCKVKLVNDGKVSEKEVTNKDKSTWISYSILVLHNGEENWLKLTGAVAKKLKKGKKGEVYTIFAVPSELKGGKAYSVSLEDEEDVGDLLSPSSPKSTWTMTQVDENNFYTILESAKKKGKTIDDIDEAMIVKALSGHMGYPLEDAELASKAFFKFVEDNNLDL